MKKYFELFRPAAYLLVLLTFAVFPLSLIENSSFCVYKNLFDILCCGCGVTRGFCAFMHFDFALAASYNGVFTYAIFPISVFLMLDDTVRIVLRLFFNKRSTSLLEEVKNAVSNLF